MKTKKVIVRTEKAGVFFGEIKERNGSEVTMTKCRKLWYWSGAAAVEQIAIDGVKNVSDCKFTVEVDEMVLLGVIQVILCTEKAVTSIKSVPEWKR